MILRMDRALLLGAALMMLLGVAAGPVWAQAGSPTPTAIQADETEAEQGEPETDDAQSATRDQPRRRSLDEVIVTATKRAQNLQEVPMSISAITDLQIEQSNMEDLNDLSRYTPNLKVQAGGIANFIYIRGLGSGFNEGFEQSVGLFIDDVYYAKPHYLITGMLDVERVEVLRGPQGTLFGKNTVAGALAIHSGTPSYEFEASADVTLGEEEQQNFQALVNIPIIDDVLSVRLAGFYWDRNGLLYSTYYDEDEQGFTLKTGRAKVRFDPLDNLTLTLTYLKNYAAIHRGGRAQLSAAPDLWLTLFRQFDEDTETDVTDFQSSLDAPAFGVQDSDDVIFHASLEALNHDFTFIAGMSSYTRDGGSDLDGTPVQVFEAFLDQEYEQYNAELRVASPPGTIEYVGGMFFNYNDISDFTEVLTSNTDNWFDQVFNFSAIEQVTNLLPAQITQLLDMLTPNNGGFMERRLALFLQDSKSASVFGQATWNMSDEVALIFGARYGIDWKDVYYNQRIGNALLFPGPTVVLGPILRLESFQQSVKRRETDFAPKASILWRATDWANLYLTVAKGGKSGGFNALALRPGETEFRPESALTYEGGIKTEFWDNSVRLNIGLFRTEFTDLQTTIFNGIDIIVANAPEAVSQGIEVDLNAIFDFGLSVIGSFAYLDAYYEEYPDGPCVARSVFIDILQGQEFCDLKGAPLANAPDIQGSLSLNQVIGGRDWPLDFTFGADILYHGRVYLQADLDPLDTQKAYWMFNLRAGVQSRDQRYSLTVFLRNVTDEIVRLGGVDAPLFDGTHIGIIDQPRTWSFHLSAKF